MVPTAFLLLLCVCVYVALVELVRESRQQKVTVNASGAKQVRINLKVLQCICSVGYNVSVNKCCSLSGPRKVLPVVFQLLEK